MNENLQYKKHEFLFKAVQNSYFIRLFFIISFILVSNTGCSSSPRPRLRLGAYFGAPFGIAYPEPDKLGKHGYTNWWGEQIGLVYTCKGGFIDLGHLRDSADRTAYCSLITYQNLLKGQTEFKLKLLEPSKYFVTIKYPENWNRQPDKEKKAREISIRVGQYLAYNAMVWHEIITWYGYKYTGFFSEYISSFSWEDLYSDIIGVDLAGRALKEDPNNFETKMTKLIYDEFNRLDVQPVRTAKKAEKRTKGKWYSGTIYPFTKLKKRNMDIGIDDGYVTPWLVAGICENTEPVSYAVPNLDFLAQYGFSIDLKIEPKIWESRRLLKIVYPDGNGKYIVPSKHFPALMKDIINGEIRRNGPEVNVPNL
ncbi:MAG: DUF4056 domain-containing protein [Sedimentisphaerales bacterium]|nr:DUF4056 domain-containing protein [Sedimentisphaerales bacterium]